MQLSLKNFLLVVLMLLAAGAAMYLKPTKKMSDGAIGIDIALSIPKRFGEWKYDNTMTPISPSPDQAQSLAAAYDQIVSYTYVNAERQQVMLSIAYGSAQKQGLRAHRQEACYQAQGFEISDLKTVDLSVLGKSVQAAQMIATYGHRVEPVTYWFTMGDHIVRSYLARQVVQLQYALSGYIPDGYLFRVSTLSSDTAAGLELQHRFTEELMRAMAPELRARLLGSM